MSNRRQEKKVVPMERETAKAFKPALNFQQMMGVDTVDLYVGPEKKLYRVHRKLLCNKVPYFEMMFRGNFKESHTKMAQFPEDDPKSFDLLIGWIYFDKLPPLKGIREVFSEGLDQVFPAWDVIVAYRLADKLCLPNLKDAVCDAYRDFCITELCLPTIECMEYAYVDLPNPSPFHDFIVHAFRWVLMPQAGFAHTLWPGSELQRFMFKHKAIMSELFDMDRQDPVVKDPRKMPSCFYHCHEEGQCYLRKKGTQ